jgi:serine/threonine-protein kinase
MRRLIPFLLGLLVLGLGGCGPAIPDLHGKTVAQARASLGADSLSVGKIAYDSAATGATWTVVAQSPKSGARDRGPVDLVLAGAPPVTVPALTGLMETPARSTANSAGLAFSASRAYSATAAVGVVLSQSPSAGSIVESGGVVATVVSDGPAPVAVPKCVGKSLSAAKKLLVKVGLKARVVRKHDSAKKDAVIAQSPRNGTLLPGRSVSLTVSDGPSLVTVPDVFAIMYKYPGLDIITPLPKIESFVNARIQGTGLTVRVEMGEDTPGQNGQFPRAGARVPRGTVILMKVLD